MMNTLKVKAIQIWVACKKLVSSSFRKAAEVESRADTSSTPNMNRWNW